jgi:rare lipoprotein A (peptidoglycan hydrolase)
MLCGALFGLPSLLLHNGGTRAPQRPKTPVALAALRTHTNVVYPSSHLDGVNLPSHLVAYQSTQSTTTTAPLAPSPTTTTAPAPTTTTTEVAHVVAAAAPPPPSTTTTTTAPPAPAHSEAGEATWYPEAAEGMCASPTLPFGTVLTVTNDVTGASTQCTVDDREGAGYPRVVDMSYSGFSQIADPSQGVVEVTISW